MESTASWCSGSNLNTVNSQSSYPMRARMVAIAQASEAAYSSRAPYHPAYEYPEYPFGTSAVSPGPSSAYSAVREAFFLLGLDRHNFGTKLWNPLSSVVQPGMTVVLKPNFVLSRHKQGKDLFGIITHPSVLRAVADYCWIALKGEGSILIADAPQYDCNFAELTNALRLDELCAFYPKGTVSVSYRDLRNYWSRGRHFPSMTEALPGDPEGQVLIDLGEKSAFHGKGHEQKLYGAVYHRSETIDRHSKGRHQYEVSATVLKADVVISCPKLKVHKKVGVTLNAKGLVGIATNKNYLVHYTLGTPSQGGDQFPENCLTRSESVLIGLERWMYDHLLAPRIKPLEYLHRSIYWVHNHTLRRAGLKVDEAKRNLDAGNWYGNDSAWRMTVDLMRILHYASREGKMCSQPQRRLFSVIDGIVGGEGNGPLTPDPVASGVVVAGEGLLATDLAATAVMGFDPEVLRMYQHLLRDPHFRFEADSLNQVRVVSNRPEWNGSAASLAPHALGFRPHAGWVGHVEWPRAVVRADPRADLLDEDAVISRAT